MSAESKYKIQKKPFVVNIIDEEKDVCVMLCPRCDSTELDFAYQTAISVYAKCQHCGYFSYALKEAMGIKGKKLKNLMELDYKESKL